MYLRSALFLTAAIFAALYQYPSTPAQAQEVNAFRVRVEVLKRSTFEPHVNPGAVLVGPQTAFELEWRLLNATGDTVDVPTPAAGLRLRVSGQGRHIPVRTDCNANMTLRSTNNGLVVSREMPPGSATLQNGESLRVRCSTKPSGSIGFPPGHYVLELEVRGVHVADGGRRTVRVDPGFPIRLRIADLDSPERQRQFHMIEGAFYRDIDKNRALEHYAALASLPGAPWSDSLPLAWMYNELGRHREACAVFRPILPELIRALDGPFGDILRTAGHIRRAAASFAVEGDPVMAASLLRLERRTPENRIGDEVERLRKSAPKPGTSHNQ